MGGHARDDGNVEELARNETRDSASSEFVEDDREDADTDDCRVLRKLEEAAHESVDVSQRFQIWRVVDVEFDEVEVEVFRYDCFKAVGEEL